MRERAKNATERNESSAHNSHSAASALAVRQPEQNSPIVQAEIRSFVRVRLTSALFVQQTNDPGVL